LGRGLHLLQDLGRFVYIAFVVDVLLSGSWAGMPPRVIVDISVLVISVGGLRLEEHAGGWALAGPAAARFGLVDEYLAYLADRNYSPKTVRAYGYDLLAFCRWLAGQDLRLVDLPGGNGPGPAGSERGPVVGWSDGPLRRNDDQPAAGRDLGTVRVRRDAGSCV
jgi:hypothetical protein